MISQTEISPLFTGQSGSLISRISRGLTSRARNKLSINDLFSPASTNFDSISTIKADDFLFDKQEDSWNIQHRSASPHYEGKSVSPTISFSGATPFSHSHDLKDTEVPSVCFRDAVSKCHKHINHDVLIDDPSPRQIQRMRVQGVGAARVQRGRGISVSWEISPTKEAPVETPLNEQPKEPENLSSHATSNVYRKSRDDLDSSRPNSNKAGEDQWREAVDPESGRTYYYNRRTRVSKWRLPTDAIVKKKDSGRRHANNSGVLIPTLSSLPQHSSRRAKSRKKIMHVSLSSDEDKLNITRTSSQEDRQFLNNDRMMNHDQSSANGLNQSQEVQKMSLFKDDSNLICTATNEKSTGINESKHTERIERAQNDTANQLSKASPVKSPSHSISHSIFCLYCGCNCESVAALSSHLPQCTRFAHMQQHGRSTQIDLEIILFRAWSQLGSSSSTDVVDSSELNTLSYESSSTRQEGEEVARSSLSQQSNPVNLRTPTPRNNKDIYTIPFYGVESKKCPFCNDIFVTGNGFSSHLLVCTVRRQVRKQRRTMKKDSPVPLTVDPRRKYVTPGRRMPWE